MRASSDRSPFCQRLVSLRKNSHMTQEDVARSLMISRTTYTCYETGVSIPDLHKLCQLADLFQVSTDFLLGRSERPSKQCGFFTGEQDMLRRYRLMSDDKKQLFIDLLGVMSP